MPGSLALFFLQARKQLFASDVADCLIKRCELKTMTKSARLRIHFATLAVFATTWTTVAFGQAPTGSPTGPATAFAGDLPATKMGEPPLLATPEAASQTWDRADLLGQVDSPLSGVTTAEYDANSVVDQGVTPVDFTFGDFTVKPYGILWGDMIYSTSRAVPGPFILWIISEEEQGEDTFIVDARRSRVGIDITGPTHDIFGGITGGGKVEVDFYDSFVNENQPGVRLRHVYWEAKNENVRFMVGQYWDVLSPLLPNTVNFSVGWAAGNVGFRRTQFRVERYFHLLNGNTLTLQGALCENIVPDLASGPRAAGVSRETGNWPMIQGRFAYTFDNPYACLPVTVGVSGHVGETGFDGGETTRRRLS